MTFGHTGSTASAATCIHSRPITDVLCVMCDNERDPERVDEVSSAVFDVNEIGM